MSGTIEAKATILDGEVTATLTLGQAKLVLTFPQAPDEQLGDDLEDLIERSYDAFADVLEAVAEAAEAQAVARG